MINGRNFMKKYLYLCCILSTAILADDLDLGADFSAGDTITASEFNSKFNKIENTLAIIQDSDLLGTWNCVFYIRNERDSFTKPSSESIMYSRSDTLTFARGGSSSTSINQPWAWTTANQNTFLSGGLTGTWTLIGNSFRPTLTDSSNTNFGNEGRRYLIFRTSENQFNMSNTNQGGGSSGAGSLTCDKAS
jgi:hypothetical protein